MHPAHAHNTAAVQNQFCTVRDSMQSATAAWRVASCWFVRLVCNGHAVAMRVYCYMIIRHCRQHVIANSWLPSRACPAFLAVPLRRTRPDCIQAQSKYGTALSRMVAYSLPPVCMITPAHYPHHAFQTCSAAQPGVCDDLRHPHCLAEEWTRPVSPQVYT